MDESEEVLDRLEGKPTPKRCPNCGEKLEVIYEKVPAIEWVDNNYFSVDATECTPSYYCSECGAYLPDELMNTIFKEAIFK